MTRNRCVLPCPPCGASRSRSMVTPEFARKKGLTNGVTIVAQSMKSDPRSSFEGDSMMKMCGVDMARAAALDLYEKASLGPRV